jgi:hypothetical protein
MSTTYTMPIIWALCLRMRSSMSYTINDIVVSDFFYFFESIPGVSTTYIS